jgi:hypothetical protein
MNKFYLYKIHINSQGYDVKGNYYGYLPNLNVYMYSNDDGNIAFKDSIRGTVRAKDRDNAKQVVLNRFPEAKFYV